MSTPSSSRFAFVAVSTLFFMWGFITCMNDLLIPKLKADFSLSQFEANLVQTAFFGAYFLVSLGYFVLSVLRGDPINRIGYQNGLCLGLLVSGAGCLLFYPAAETHAYGLFLGALLVLGAGITLIQIAANPYVAILGAPETAPSRLNLSQGVNSLGYVIAPLIGGLLLFGSGVFSSAGGASAVKAPYVGLAIAFFVLAAVFKGLKLPALAAPEAVRPGAGALRHPHFVWGMLAIFFYVGSEVTIGSILINYLGASDVLGLPAHEADKYLSFYWGGLMIGRLMGAISLGDMAPRRKLVGMLLAATVATVIIFAAATFKHRLTSGEFISVASVVPYLAMVALSFAFFALGRTGAGRMIGLFALAAGLLTVGSISTHGEFALWSIIGIGLFNSIMWSNIFTLAIRGLGADTAQGSSLLVMMIVGGAIMPAVQGALADVVGVRWSLAVVLLGYLYLAFYGFVGSKIGVRPDSPSTPTPRPVGGH